MVKTKLFVANYGYQKEHKNVDDLVNEFLERNKGIEVVDVKLSTSNDSYAVLYHALLIYKEPAN